jgi:hypothetical protein
VAYSGLDQVGKLSKDSSGWYFIQNGARVNVSGGTLYRLLLNSVRPHVHSAQDIEGLPAPATVSLPDYSQTFADLWAAISAAQQTADANSGGGSTTITNQYTGVTATISSAEPTGPKEGDLWYDSTNGYRLNQWNGSAWQPYQFGTGAIAAGSITAAQIAADTITAAELASGIVVSGIIDGTTVTGATVESDDGSGNTITLQAGDLTVQSANPGDPFIELFSSVLSFGWGSQPTFTQAEIQSGLSSNSISLIISSGQAASGDTSSELVFYSKKDAASPVTGTPAIQVQGLMIADNAWTNFSLQNSFSAGNDIGGTSYPPAYRMLPDGNVALRGTLVTPSSGTVNQVTFATIPAANGFGVSYRPSTNIPTATVANGSGGQVGQVFIRPNGNVQLNGAFATSSTIRLDCTINVAGT